MHKASRSYLKGAVSAQKALQGSETETRELLEGTEKNSVSQSGFNGQGPGWQIDYLYIPGTPNI